MWPIVTKEHLDNLADKGLIDRTWSECDRDLDLHEFQNARIEDAASARPRPVFSTEGAFYRIGFDVFGGRNNDKLVYELPVLRVRTVLEAAARSAEISCRTLLFYEFPDFYEHNKFQRKLLVATGQEQADKLAEVAAAFKQQVLDDKDSYFLRKGCAMSYREPSVLHEFIEDVLPRKSTRLNIPALAEKDGQICFRHTDHYHTYHEGLNPNEVIKGIENGSFDILSGCFVLG